VRLHRTQLFIWLVAFVIAIDQITKAWVIDDVRTRTTLLGVVRIVHIDNPSFAGGRFSAQTWLAALIASGCLVGLIGTAIALGARAWLWLPAGLVVGGTLSNVVDRVRLGFVTDFVAVGPLGQANLADIAIVIGGFGVAGLICFTAWSRRADMPAADGRAESQA
jgi:signal peptidase II